MHSINCVIQPDEWEIRANKIHSHFNWDKPEDINLEELCWRYGVKIKSLDSKLLVEELTFESVEHLKAFSIPQKKGRRGTIYLSPYLNNIEKRLILAEEFCHCYAHFSSQLNIDNHCIHKQENQAKRMAAYLLMPAKFLNIIYENAINESVLISDIADYFLVTEEFAHFRIELIYKHKVDGFAVLKNRLESIDYFL